MLVIFITWDVFSYLTGQYTGLKYCQSAAATMTMTSTTTDAITGIINETDEYYNVENKYISMLLRLRYYTAVGERKLILVLGKGATFILDFFIIYILQWVSDSNTRGNNNYNRRHVRYARRS